MLTKYSLIFLLLSTNFLLINSMKKYKSVAENEKGKGKEKENTDQSQSPQHSQQPQPQQTVHGKDKGKEIVTTHQISTLPSELPATKIINLGPKPVIDKKKRFIPSKKAPIILHVIDDNSKYASMVQKFTGIPADAKKASERLNIQNSLNPKPISSQTHPNEPSGTVNFPALIEKILSGQPIGNFQFHQQNMQGIQPNVGIQYKIGNEFYGIGGSAEGSNIGTNQATGHTTTFSDQLGKGGFNWNLGNDSSGQFSGFQKLQGIGGSSGIPRSTADENRGTGQLLLGMGNILNYGQIAGLQIQKQQGIERENHGSVEGSNRLVDGNQETGQLGLRKGRFDLNSAPFSEIHQQHGIGGNSGIHRPTGNDEGSGSRKYSYHQFLVKGKSSGNEESNQELSGSETESDDGIAQQFSQETSETVVVRKAPSTELKLNTNTDQLQQIFLGHKRSRKDSISKKEGTSKSIPNESDKFASQNQEEFSPPHSSQKLPLEKKSKKQ